MEIEKQKDQTKLLTRIEILLYERMQWKIKGEKSRHRKIRHESFQTEERASNFYALCARRNKNKNILVDIARSNSRQSGEKRKTPTKTIRERIVRGSRGYFSSGRAPLSPPSSPLPSCNHGWMDGWMGRPPPTIFLLITSPPLVRRFFRKTAGNDSPNRK